MKKQVLESDDFFSRTKYLLKLCRLGMLSVFLVGSILTLLTIPFAKSIIDLLVVELASLLFVSPAFITFFRGIKKQKEILKDIKKNRLFVKNEMLFQVNLVDDIKLNKKISDNTKKEVESIIKLNNNSINEITHPTVNDIDNASYKTILELYDVLKNSDRALSIYEIKDELNLEKVEDLKVLGD